ncbi:phage protease [Marichromatium gracile]|uniref:Phage I-like protein n=1 Tax=Marichromatium gracile TaxID=1048 RepID=A0A4R4ABE5_MARGR|nr:phage protease [Marichromatium gracile]MBK1710583.1 hypothetical protein [Marichromatium gracile]MBO8085762.1 hypothetical protein [Marichromatium sp.]TCW36297.1 phage I-like protein [Marichromatium gracile]
MESHPFTSSPACAQALAPSAGGAPPEWLLLVPAGEIAGRDGRAYRNDRPEAVVAAFEPEAEIPLDWEHATHLRAPRGEQAPAAGWISALALCDGAVWGRVAWTAAGAEAVRARAYRYYSPAYRLDAEGRVTRLLSVGLTNQPNLRLPALNQRTRPEDPAMDETIRQALDLPEGATPAQAVTAIEALRTRLDHARTEAATPDLARFAPRADLDAALNRAQAAEQALAEGRRAELAREIDALIAEGLNRARITPATVDYHRAQAATAGGLERLRAYLDTAPALVGTAPGAGGAPPATPPGLDAAQRRIAAAFGLGAEDLERWGGAA